jgi:hypothetical protein
VRRPTVWVIKWSEKINKQHNTPGLRRLQINNDTHNNQPTTGGHDGGEDGKEVRRAGGGREAPLLEGAKSKEGKYI